MADTGALGDLATAVSDVLRGDRATALRDMAAAAERRVRGRLRDGSAPPDQQPAAPIQVAAPQRIPQPAPARAVNLRLANGSRIRAVIVPAVARRRDLAAVARASAINDRRAFAALRRHRRAIARLDRSNAALTDQVSTLQAQADVTLSGLVTGFAGFERQVRNAVRPQVVAAAGQPPPSSVGEPRETRPVRRVRQSPQLQRLQQARALRAQAFRAQVKEVTNVVNTVQATAFGQRGSVFATNNLLLAGNQLFWTFLDPVLQRVGVLDATSATVVAALAPLGTLATGQILLADRQHVRFISGVAVFDGTNVLVVESLRGKVSEQLFPEFQKRTDVPITTQLLDPPSNLASFSAAVVNGSVRIRIVVADVEGALPKIRIAWTVDTGEDVG
ncbi:MAG TPA: hypothetical protein VKE51_42905 [Vicinamibacterales bacterium]|nr:hypothetical protein [Vicinamibacterales bacterium]